MSWSSKTAIESVIVLSRASINMLVMVTGSSLSVDIMKSYCDTHTGLSY